MRGRSRKSRKPIQHSSKSDSDEDDGQNIPDPTSEEYLFDEVDKFHLKKDKILLEDVKEDDEASDAESDEEDVMGIDADVSDEDSDDEEADDEVKDVSDEEEDEESSDDDGKKGLPSEKAWGRTKKSFYDADVKDDDIFASDEEAEIAAEEEEKEAMSLQKRMASKLDDSDFDVFQTEDNDGAETDDAGDDEEIEELVVKDLSKLTKEDKIEILIKDSPELFELIEEFKEKLTKVIDTYHPLLLVARQGKLVSEKGLAFIEIMHQVLLNYCVNIGFYLTLKANKESVKDHPVIERLVQHRDLLQKLEPLENNVECEMKKLLEASKGVQAPNMENKEPKKKTEKNLKNMLEKMSKTVPKNSLLGKRKTTKPTEKINQKRKKESQMDPLEYYNMFAEKKKKKSQEKTECIGDTINDEDNDAEGKRAITYEMAKNKGLTRRRKKELRNPRVKHKMKFKKAIVKRKSQVREVKKELSRYGGEATGIKANLTRSVKIK